mmetsp:Transcript_120534/g.276168  ORF Transcript_120534/g.276168 Transcript_120534/m.276168 type:complete len:244 (-) Transcript_120534:160-891(-)
MHIVAQIKLLLAIHRIRIVPQSQVRVMPGILSPVPAGEVWRPLHRRLQNPSLTVGVPTKHRWSRSNHPLLAIPGGKHELVEPSPVKSDGPGRRIRRCVLLAVSLSASQSVGGRVPSKSGRNVTDNLPAAAVDPRALPTSLSLVPHVHISTPMRPHQRSVARGADTTIQNLARVVANADPRILPIPVSPVPSSPVRRLPRVRLKNQTMLARVPAEDRCFRCNNPSLAISGGKKKFVELGVRELL